MVYGSVGIRMHHAAVEKWQQAAGIVVTPGG